MRDCTSICRRAVPAVCLAAVLFAVAPLAADDKNSQKLLSGFDPVSQFEHVGIFTGEKKPNERFVAASKVWVTDFAKHPYRIEWLRSDRPAKRPVRENPHIAFRVENIEKAEKAAKGLHATSKPFDAGIARVAFYRSDDGATVEFMEYYKPSEAASLAAKSAGRKDAPMQFDHVGLITNEKKPGERFVAATKVWVTDIEAHPYRVEWLRFEPDSPVTGPVREKTHVGFRVKSIAEACKGLKVLIAPFDAGIATVAFFETTDGSVVEFMEYHKK